MRCTQGRGLEALAHPTGAGDRIWTPPSLGDLHNVPERELNYLLLKRTLIIFVALLAYAIFFVLFATFCAICALPSWIRARLNGSSPSR